MGNFRTLLSMTALSFTYSCTPAPPAVAPDATAQLPVRKDFQAKGLETPQISRSLLTLFTSSELKSAVQTALANNPNLLISQSQIREAELNLKNSKTSRLPEVNSAGSLGRTGRSGNSSALYSVSANASWEIDLWKKIETEIIATQNDLKIAKMLHQSARESIAAQVIQAWVRVLTQEKRIALSQKRLASFKQTLKLVNRKFENGTSDLGAITLAEADIQSTEAEIASRTDARNQASRNLASLMGKYPKVSSTNSNWPSLHKSVRAGTPSSLLRRRPDLQIAYLEIVAADLDVSLAHKELYPDFNLTSNLGQSSSILSQLARSNFNSWSLLANISTPIFDAGRRKIDIAIQQEQATQAIQNYRQTFLTALEEVENALGSESKLETQEERLNAALKSSVKAEERIQRRYENGLADILDLLETQRRRFNTEDSLISIQSERLLNRINLALAVGTGI